MPLKFFAPDAGSTWFVTEGQPDDEDFRFFFGFVIGLEEEWGFLFSQLSAVRGPLSLPVEAEGHGHARPRTAAAIGACGVDIAPFTVGGRPMKLIDLLPPQQRRDLRRLRYRIAKRQYMRRVREERKLLCVGVDLPIDAGTCGRFVHAGYQRCIHCTRRRWWLLTRAFNAAEVSISAMLEEHAAQNDALYGVPRWLLTRAFSAAEVSSAATLEDRAAENDALYGVPQAVPLLEDVGDPCLRW